MINGYQSKFDNNVISGETIFFRIHAQYKDPQYENKAFRYYLDSLDELKHGIKQEIVKSLGEAFDIKSITIGRGSIEVLIVVGTEYYAISRYNNFIESVELLSSQVKKVAGRLFGTIAAEQPDISVTWTPGPALARLNSSRDGCILIHSDLLIYYLILSHAALLSFVLWMLYGYFRR